MFRRPPPLKNDRIIMKIKDKEIIINIKTIKVLIGIIICYIVLKASQIYGAANNFPTINKQASFKNSENV